MASATPVPSQPMGEFARLSAVLFEPSAAFRDIAAHPRWWPPVAIIIVLSLAFMYTFNQRVGFERFYRQQAETNSQMQKMNPAQREQTIAVQVKIAPAIFYGLSVIGTPVMAAIVAAVFLLIFKTFLGAQIRFGQIYAVCCYALVPLIFSSVMAFAMLLLKEPDQFDLQNATPSNIAAFLDATSTPKWLYTLLSSLDVFTLWSVVLLATGLSVASRKVSWSSALVWVVATWGLWVALKVGMTAAFS